MYCIEDLKNKIIKGNVFVDFTKENLFHPTQKPLKIIKRIIENSSDENDIVLDLFLGCGTTAIAAKELNRNYIGVEIDEYFYDIASRRLNNQK